MSAKAKKRVTIDMSKSQFQRLERLKLLVDAESKAEVIRNALRLLEYMADRDRDGYVFLHQKDGVQTEVPVFAIM